MGDLLARLRDVQLKRGARQVLAGVDLDIPRGARLALLGPSGAGKSTLLRILDGSLAPDAGTVDLWGVDGAPRCAVALQDAGLFPWLTIAENVAAGASFGPHTSRLEDDRVRFLLDRLDLTGVAASYPDEVSGGQAQRASLARALAVEPELLLLDEPLSALDPLTRADLQGFLTDECERTGATCVLVTHDVEEAFAVAERVVLLGGAGRSGQLGHGWDLPAEHRAREFVRSEVLEAYRPTEQAAVHAA